MQSRVSVLSSQPLNETVFEGMSYLQSVWHLPSKHLICESKFHRSDKLFKNVYFCLVSDCLFPLIGKKKINDKSPFLISQHLEQKLDNTGYSQ